MSKARGARGAQLGDQARADGVPLDRGSGRACNCVRSGRIWGRRAGDSDRYRSSAETAGSALRTAMLDPRQRIIDNVSTWRTPYPELSAVRLFQEQRAAGYPGGYGQVTSSLRAPSPAPDLQRSRYSGSRLHGFHQGQVDFAPVPATLWGQPATPLIARAAGYSIRLMWLQYFEPQTMAVLINSRWVWSRDGSGLGATLHKAFTIGTSIRHQWAVSSRTAARPEGSAGRRTRS